MPARPGATLTQRLGFVLLALAALVVVVPILLVIGADRGAGHRGLDA